MYSLASNKRSLCSKTHPFFQVIFPVPYDNKFYKRLLNKDNSDVYCKIAFTGKEFVGGITCKVEASSNKLYIMTLACYATYRRQGVGSRLLTDVMSSFPNVASIYLHVQATNEDAVSFYRRFGFEVVETQKNYYRRMFDDKKSVHSPLDAFVLEKKITERWNNFDQYVVLVKIQIRQSSTNQIWSKQCLLKIKTSLLDHDFSLFGLFWNFMFNSNILNWPTQFRHVWYLLHFNPTK